MASKPRTCRPTPPPSMHQTTPPLMHTPPTPPPQHAPGHTTTETLTPGSHGQPRFKPSSLSCGQEMGIPLLVSLATWDDVLGGGAPGSRSTDESGLDRTLGW